MKTSELTGIALDWAVAKCEGGAGLWYDGIATYWITLDGKDRALSKGWAQSYTPSTNWTQGGPIIEREGICLADAAGRYWVAGLLHEDKEYDGFKRAEEQGPTPLIAAMRCYVASKLGDDVEIPEELMKENQL
jgi:hypothetical protein